MANRAKSSPACRAAAFLAVTSVLAFLFFVPTGDAAKRPAWAALHALLGIAGIKSGDHPHFVVANALFLFVLVAVFALIPLAASLIAGRRILAWTRLELEDCRENCVFACAVGFGGLALFTLLVGVSIGLRQGLFAAATVAILVLGRRDLVTVCSDVAAWRREVKVGGELFWILLTGLPALVIIVFGFFACYMPPLDYDVLEYHLGAPAYWFREGRISFIRYNVYSNFPFNTEMLYLYCMSLMGDRMLGALAGKLVNLQLGLLCTAAIGLAGRRIFGPRAGWIASLTFLICPWFALSAIRAYDTLALSLYTFLSVYCIYCYFQVSEKEDGRRKWLLRGAVTIGLAMGTKYPSFLFLWVPAVLAVLAEGLARESDRQKLLRRVSAIALIPLLLAGPWLVKNTVNTGNPFYPLLGGLIGGEEWDDAREAKFGQAHRAPLLGPVGLLHELGNRTLGRQSTCLLLLVFLPPLVWSPKRREPLFFLGYSLLFFLLWAYLTHRIDRFLVPALPGLCLLAGAGFSACSGRALRIAANCVLGCLLVFHAFEAAALPHADLGWLDRDLFALDSERLARKHSGASIDIMRFMNEHLEPEDKVLFVGDAQTFYCSRNYFMAATVFDRQWLDEAAGAQGPAAGPPHFERTRVEGTLAWLRERGVTHIYLNWPEAYRLQSTYAYEFEGARRPGYLNCLPMTSVDPSLIENERGRDFLHRSTQEGALFSPSTLRRHLVLVKGFGEAAPRIPLIGLYRIADAQ